MWYITLTHTNPETTNPPRKTSQSQSWALKNTTTNMQHQSKIIATVAGSFKVARLQNCSSSSQVCDTWPGSRGWGWASLCGSGKWAGQSELYTSEGATPSEAGACREANVNWLVFARIAHFACGAWRMIPWRPLMRCGCGLSGNLGWLAESVLKITQCTKKLSELRLSDPKGHYRYTCKGQKMNF